MNADLQLFVFSADPELAAAAGAGGAAGVVVDWERRGKRERQLGFDTQIGADTAADLAAVRAATTGRVVCRVNGWGPGTAGEVAAAVALGADEVLLPMVRRPDEVDEALDVVGGRCGLGILVETVDAVACVDALAARPLCRIYVGLNDLMIERGGRCLFEPLVDGTVDRVRAAVTCPFGVAGLTLPGRGHPVPTRLLAAELARLGADFTFLRRSFLADAADGALACSLGAVSAMAAEARRATPTRATADRRDLVATVAALTGGPDLAPTAVRGATVARPLAPAGMRPGSATTRAGADAARPGATRSTAVAAAGTRP